MTNEHRLVERARRAPDAPGVYRFLNASGEVLYVGKARVLRQRVLSYFTRGELPERTRRMVGAAHHLDFTVTASEIEALILENTLIKRHRPPFNVLLRDDKTYPYIRVTTGEQWPRVELTRRVRTGDGHTYFGPFMGRRMARRLMEIARLRFQVRTCHLEIDGSLDRPCLYHAMDACLGPCVAGLTDESAYGESVEELLLFLSGRHEELIDRLERTMWAFAEREEYERAARLRNLVGVVRRLGERQDVEQPGRGDADVVAWYGDGEHATVCVLPYRDGKLVDKRELHFEGVGDVAPAELLATFLPQFYETNPAVPPMVDLAQPVEEEDRELIERYLGARRGRRVRLAVPKRDARVRRSELAIRNAEAAFRLRFRSPRGEADRVAERLAEALGLDRPVRCIEGFDVSHASGKATTASCVTWREGRMENRQYRTFTIKGVDGIDDFGAMAEVVGRRYRRLRDENGELPDLVLVDGGPGQLTSAVSALATLGIDLPVAALAKREELVYRPERDEPVRFDRSDSAHLVLRRVRDEAHRFAVSRQRRRREKDTLSSRLLEIPGIGPGRARALLRRFGSLRSVQSAPEDELKRALGPRLGTQVWRHLHRE